MNDDNHLGNDITHKQQKIKLQDRVCDKQRNNIKSVNYKRNKRQELLKTT